jgi:DNA polymerase-1
LEKISSAEEFALDLETTSEDPLSAEIVGIALSVEPYHGYYIPVAHRYRGAPEQLSLERVLAALRPILTAEKPKKIGQNLKYDLQVLLNYGIEVRGVAFDAMIAHWLLWPDAPSHSLETIAREELGVQVQTYRELLAQGGEKEIREVPVERAARYSGEDAEMVMRLRAPLTRKLQEAELLGLFQDLEIPSSRCFFGWSAAASFWMWMSSAPKERSSRSCSKKRGRNSLLSPAGLLTQTPPRRCGRSSTNA